MKAIAKADAEIEEFCSLIQQGVDAWTEAGKRLCKMVDSDPQIYARILQKYPYLTRETLEQFERIGRKRVYPYLVVDGSPGARRLAALPYKEQVRIYRGKLSVVTVARGITVEKSKRVFELTWHEAARVFDGNRIRSVQEQIHRLNRKRTNIASARNGSSHHSVVPAETESSVSASLEAAPLAELKRLLTLANDALLEARTALSVINRGSRKDVHITNALIEVGSLRYAANEGEL